MNLESLKTFCAGYGTTEHPWSTDEHTYASDNFLLVRVPRMAEVTNMDGPKITGLYRDGPMPESGWVDLPSDEVIGKMTECPDCHGKEGEEGVCPECDGDGEIEISTDFHTYTVDCKTCEGDGEPLECKTCKGRGFTQPNEHVELGGKKFNACYIRSLKELGNTQFTMSGKLGWFRFDGGDALLMPITEAANWK